MQDGKTDMLDIYVQRELGEFLRKRLRDSEDSGMSTTIAALLDELRDAQEPDSQRR